MNIKPVGAKHDRSYTRICTEVLQLPLPERVYLVEMLLSSLDRADEVIDKQWGDESENRIDAYERGEIKSIPMQKVFSKYRKP